MLKVRRGCDVIDIGRIREMANLEATRFYSTNTRYYTLSNEICPYVACVSCNLFQLLGVMLGHLIDNKASRIAAIGVRLP